MMVTEGLVTQMELKLGIIGSDPCKCKGPVVEPQRNHKLVWKNSEREEQRGVRLETGKKKDCGPMKAIRTFYYRCRGKPWKGAADGAETDGMFPP